MRKELRTRISQLENKESRTLQLIEHLSDFLQNRSGFWGMYQALESEISLTALQAQTPHLHWVFPKVMNGTLHFFEPRNGFERAYAGILEPVLENALEVPLNTLSGVLVPGLGFDRKGVRLGKGKGYYDRALSAFPGETVGIVFETLVVDELPRDPWDVPMQWLATELGVKKVGV